MKKNIAQYYIYLMILFIVALGGCRKYVEIGTPPDKITQENVFSTDKSATTVLTGICDVLSRIGADIAEYGGLLADEWTLWPGAFFTYTPYYTNAFKSEPGIGAEIWNTYFNHIFRCNAALEGIIDNKNLSSSVQKQLLGEAYFLRAFFYFYLVNFYGDLPLAVTTDPEINRLLPRSSVEQVYKLMIDDLLKAEQLLSADFVNGQLIPYTTDAQRVRPTKWAASALLARVYLYAGQWSNAEIEAGKLISNTNLFNLSVLPDIFLKNSSETIFQAQPTIVGWNTQDARRFHLTAAPSGLSGEKRVHLSQFMMNAFEFEDQRRIQWVDSLIDGTTTYYFPVKYKIAEENPSINTAGGLTEYCMIFRLSEQYLNRAEVRARQNNLTGAIDDVDKIRNRAGVPLIANTNPGISQEELLSVILHERQVELLSEWGNRWFDLKRFNMVDEVMNIVTPSKGGSWETTDRLLPIPYDDLLRNPKLVQNAGY